MPAARRSRIPWLFFAVAIAALLVLVVLQSLNNAVFDPLLGPKPEQQPTGGRGALDLIDAMVDTAA